MMFDLHVHSVYSDGVLVPAELARRFADVGYDLVGIADHIDFTNVDLIGRVRTGVEKQVNEDVEVAVGAELTHVPPDKISELAGRARREGASHVVVHGETIVEPVEPGTNAAAVRCRDVDVLAHPGVLSIEDAEAARENDVFLEVTTRTTHGLGNGRVVEVAREAGAGLILNSDFHHPRDLPTREFRENVVRSAGLSVDDDAFLNDPSEILG
ncbi:MAG: hypothetical protein MAG715_00837 [Methanonatronarchaeales archaeon]|nr:hypothetical protein [Methanonatronarchaeales archaeon]